MNMVKASPVSHTFFQIGLSASFGASFKNRDFYYIVLKLMSFILVLYTPSLSTCSSLIECLTHTIKFLSEIGFSLMVNMSRGPVLFLLCG